MFSGIFLQETKLRFLIEQLKYNINNINSKNNLLNRILVELN